MSSEANNDAAESPATQSPDVSEPDSHGAQAVAEQALPSVIIDPSASQPSETADLPAEASDVAETSASTSTSTLEATVADVATAATIAESGASPDTDSEADDDGEWSVGAFSEHEADQFADSMRASWDVSTAEAETSWAAASIPVAGTNAKSARPLAPSTDSDDLPPVALAKGFDRRVLLAGAGALLMIITVVWSMSGDEPEAPPSWNKQTSATEPPQVVAPNEASVAPPSPAVPTPPASQPQVAREPVAPREIPSVPTKALATEAPRDVPSKSVHVRISTVPSSADVKLDGETVPNPFDAWVARGGTHTIVATADGYIEREWSVAFDQDQTLSLALKAEEVRRPAARRTRRAPPKKPTSQSAGRPRGAGFVTDNPY